MKSKLITIRNRWYAGDIAVAEGTSGTKVGTFFICEDNKKFGTCI